MWILRSRRRGGRSRREGSGGGEGGRGGEGAEGGEGEGEGDGAGLGEGARGCEGGGGGEGAGGGAGAQGGEGEGEGEGSRGGGGEESGGEEGAHGPAGGGASLQLSPASTEESDAEPELIGSLCTSFVTLGRRYKTRRGSPTGNRPFLCFFLHFAPSANMNFIGKLFFFNSPVGLGYTHSTCPSKYYETVPLLMYMSVYPKYM